MKGQRDFEGLEALFADAGFTGAESKLYLESAIPRKRLATVEKADRVEGGAGICVEAKK